MNDVMERLARANPVPTGDAVSADEQGDADALLERILAEPDAAASAAPVRRRPFVRRVAPAAVGLALVALAVVVVTDLLSSEERGNRIVDRAIAAVSQKDVIYAITARQIFRDRALEPGARPSPDYATVLRMYLWSGGERTRFLVYSLRADGRPGRLRQETVREEGLESQFLARFNTISVGLRPLNSGRTERKKPDEDAYPGFNPASDAGAQLRALVDEGRLRVTGTTTVRGRKAYRLNWRSSGVPKGGIESRAVTYLVDARSYLPLELRDRTISSMEDGRHLMVARIEFLRYEALPVSKQNLQLLAMGPHPRARKHDNTP